LRISQAVIGKTVFYFSNYTKERVDIGLIDENGNTHKFLDLPLSKAMVLWLNESETPKVKRIKSAGNTLNEIHGAVSLQWNLTSAAYDGPMYIIKASKVTSATWLKGGGKTLFSLTNGLIVSQGIKRLNFSSDNEQALNDIYNIAVPAIKCPTSPTDCVSALIASSRPIIEVSSMLVHEYEESGRRQEMVDKLGSSVLPTISFDHYPSLLESNDLNSTYKVKFIGEAKSYIPDTNIAEYFWYITDKKNHVLRTWF